MALIAAEIIKKKREDSRLTDEEIDFMVLGYTKGQIPDYQMAAFLMADVSGRRPDEFRHRVLLHKFAHIESNKRAFRTKKKIGERACDLGLADAGRAKE